MVTSPSVAVISAVADVLEVAPTKLGPFQDAVDSDALDGLFRDGSGVESPVTVSFRYEECDVTASSAGFVSVAPDSGADGGER